MEEMRRLRGGSTRREQNTVAGDAFLEIGSSSGTGNVALLDASTIGPHLKWEQSSGYWSDPRTGGSSPG